MKKQALFSLKDKSKKLKCRLLQFLFGALRVKTKSKHRRCEIALLFQLGQLKTGLDVKRVL